MILSINTTDKDDHDNDGNLQAFTEMGTKVDVGRMDSNHGN